MELNAGRAPGAFADFASVNRDMSAAEAKAFGTAFLESIITACKEAPPETLTAMKTMLNTVSEPEPPVQRPALTDIESKALIFIQDRLSRDESPSVRDLRGILSFKSSRSSLLVINKLIEKGYLRRSHVGRLFLAT